MSSPSFTLIKNFDTPYADKIASIMIKEWGFNYTDGFKYKSIDEYKLWKKDTLILIASDPDNQDLLGMIAYETYNMANNGGRWTPCLCCLWVTESQRKKGLGTELLQRMTDICRRNKLPPDYLNNPRHDLYLWFIDSSLIPFFERSKWRYLVPWNYLNRRVHIMYRDLRND